MTDQLTAAAAAQPAGAPAERLTTASRFSLDQSVLFHRGDRWGRLVRVRDAPSALYDKGSFPIFHCTEKEMTK